MALSTVAGIFGSPTVQVLLDKTTSFIAENYELHSSVKTNLARLKDSLVAVQSVVKAAEKQQIQDETLNDWLLNLKEIAYEADDLIDTFEYLHLKQKVERKSSVISVCDTVKSVLSPDDEIKELSFLVERLERLASNVGSFIQLLSLEAQSQKHVDISEQRTTSCFLPFEHSFVGRVEEKEDIINILRTTERRGARNVPVLPIIGIGGVGKTTLAQVVYNDEEVKKHFSLKMWVCVSENFDVFRLTKEILDNSGCEASKYRDVKSLNRLQEILKKTLSSQNFLLVLDDIWNETAKTSWDKLKAPLCYGKDGSMILLTSRLPKVAKLMGTVDPIELEGLPEDEYWSFFLEQSFGGANPEEHPRLVDIGKKIASKLKGSPLAAKTMGALLNDNLDVDHWDSISKSEIWELEKDQDGIMAALKLSYLHLPAHLRQCFAYLSIYPKDWEFKRDDVIRMWMAQGMIHLDSRTKRIEDVGKDYFNELISKSFFQPVNHYKDEYTIHDLLHDLAESVSKDDCFRIDGDEFRTIPTTIRHLYLNVKHLAKLKENKVVLEKLRTLIVSYSTHDDDLQDVIRQLRKIRLLAVRLYDLKKCPDNLSSLIHLRHLQLYDIEELELPEELTKLYHLQTLDLDESGIFSFEALSMVPGIGKLTCLHELGMFRVQRDPEFQIVQLKDLRELRGYLIIKNLDCVDSKEEAEEAKLCDKMYLEKLYLVWDEEKNMKKFDEVEVGILEGLRPNPNLKRLRIDGYRGTLSPSWMVHNHSITNLVSLTIYNCRAWKELPPIGQLKWLQRLKICGMDAVKEVGTEFHGKDGFPSLESLVLKNFPQLEDFPQWEEWTTEEKVILFPRLLSFQIRGCPKLKSVPPLPTTLNELTLRKVGLTVLPKLQMASSSLSSSLETLAISRWINLKSVGEWFLQHHNNLRHLAEVNIEWSGNELGRVEHDDEWKPLALNGFSKLIALESLNISHCNIFVTSDTEEDSGLLPPSLKYLYLDDCFVSDNILLKCLQGLSSLGSLKIFGLTTISFPSFKSLPSLKILQIKKCPEITIITGLEQLTQLKSLEIWRCERLSLISSLEGLSSLETLYVSETKITTIIGLEQLTQLKHLFIYL